MALPIELLGALAVVGLVAICCAILWSAPQLWYRIKYSRFKPTYEELELNHLREMQSLRTQSLQDDLEAATTRANTLDTQLQETLDKLVSKL